MPFRILGEPWKTLGGPFGGILGSGPRGQLGVEFLFRDDFITAEAAPLTSPRTAEPGPGIAVITDTGNNYNISSGRVVVSGRVSSVDPNYFTTSSYARTVGLTLFVKHERTIVRRSNIEWSRNQAVNTEHGISFDTANQLKVFIGALQPAIGSYVINTEYSLAIVLRSAGAFYLIKGGIYTEWTLLWIDDSLNNTPLFAGFYERLWLGNIFYDDFHISQLPSPWDTDYGIATDRLAGARNIGDIFVHEADCLIEFDITVFGGANAILLSYRIQDANNLWQVGVTAGGVLQIREIIAGVPNVRANTGLGAIVGGERIVVIADNETLRYYIDNVLTLTYALAANFKTETDGELTSEGPGNSISDIVSWPRVVSGLARRALDRVANA